MNSALNRPPAYSPVSKKNDSPINTKNSNTEVRTEIHLNPHYRGKLSASLLRRILKNYPVYEKAAQATKVPWEILAALHFRESSLLTTTNLPGGPFQFDPPLNRGEKDFKTAALLAGQFLQQKMDYRLNLETKDARLVQEAFWTYNGRAFGSPDKSAYVMNGLDERHQNMRLTGTVIQKNGERIRVDIRDKRLGAYPFYLELRKAFGKES